MLNNASKEVGIHFKKKSMAKCGNEIRRLKIMRK